MHPCRSLPVVALVALTALVACSEDDEEPAVTGTTEVPETTETTEPSESEPSEPEESDDEPLTILVTNDDGVDAEGLATLVDGLAALDGVELVVVAPAEQQSGTGGSTTEGTLTTSPATVGEQEATAVDGFPADTIRVAFDDLGVEPDLVVSGINEGQNLGPAADLSGTVGAARAAVERGVPALAVSQGTGATFDYDAAVPLVVEWIEDSRGALVAGDEPVEVTNINVPSCAAGEVRGLVGVEPDLGGDLGDSLGEQDCESTVPEDDLTTDVEAFLAGFATESVLPAAAG